MRSAQRLSGLALVALCTLTAPVVAQGTGCGSQWKMPAVGSWAEWQGKDGKSRVALVSQEAKGGKTLYRLEMASDRGTMQMVVPSFPFEMDQVDEMVMQQNGQPPMKMTGQTLAAMRSNMPTNTGMSALARKCGTMKVVGEETLTVPAGTFKTTHLKNDEGDEVWASPDVPFTMVKFKGKDSESVLAGQGKDAKTAIVGTPTEMNPGMMMGPPKN